MVYIITFEEYPEQIAGLIESPTPLDQFALYEEWCNLNQAKDAVHKMVHGQSYKYDGHAFLAWLCSDRGCTKLEYGEIWVDPKSSNFKRQHEG